MAKHIHVYVTDENRVDKGLADKILVQLREPIKSIRAMEFGDPKNTKLADEADRLMREAASKLTQIG